ncbi:MAG: DinB family protein [Fimbriimonadaceae bacterium]|nr:DinB family protein [Fimbriimonadaceae bacterium]
MSQSLAKKVLDDSGFQVSQVFAGLKNEDWQQRLLPSTMSPQEVIHHLTECCKAASHRITQGTEFEGWGKTTMAGTTPEEWMEEFNACRAQAISAGLEEDNERHQMTLIDLLALHEAYHVGQLCTLRLQIDPDWNYLSIYGMTE